MTRARALLVVTVIVTLLAASCSGGKKKTTTRATGACPTGTLSGAGSNFLDALVQRWAKDYTARCKGATVNYQALGSAAGIQQFANGGVDFAAVDAPLSPEQEQAASAHSGQVLHVPWAGGGVAIEYHLAGVSPLNLTPDTLLGIFTGAITHWNDPRLYADNAAAKLPADPIHVFYRSDDTPVTAALTGYLSAQASKTWTAGSAQHLTAWPVGQAADGAPGMAKALDEMPGAIGYAGASDAKPSSAGVALLKNPAGKLVLPQPAPMTAALDEAAVPTDLKVVPNYAPASLEAYPITFPTWSVVFAKFGDQSKVNLLRGFLRYALDQGQAAVAQLSYAPLPSSLRDKARTALDTIQPSTGPTTTTTTGSTTTTVAGAGPTSTAARVRPGAPGTAGALIFPAPPGGNGGATDVGVTGGALVVGNVSTQGGPVPGLMSGAVAGTSAFFAYQNSVGGVYGRGLSVASADDGFDAGRNQAGYAGLVDKVFAFVGSFSAVDQGGASVLGQHQGVPDVSEAVARSHFALANNFSVAPFPPGWQLGPLNYFKGKYPGPIGHMAIFAVNTPTATDAMAGERGAAESAGYHFSYSRVLEPTETSFANDVVQMKAANVQGVMMLSSVGQMTAMATEMQKQAFHPPFLNWAPNAYDPAFLTPGGATNGSVLNQPLAMYAGQDNLPEVQLFLQWLKRVTPNQRPDIYAAYGWASARLFVQALGAAGPRPTQASVMAALKGIDNYDGNGMLAPAGPASKRPPTCFMTMTVNNGAFTRADPASGFICDQGGYYRLP